MQIIGLGHKREVGKDLTGTLMFKELTVSKPDLKILKLGFADPIYEIAHKMYAWAGMQTKMYYDEHKEQKETELLKIGLTARKILIDVGMKFREIYPKTWLDYTLTRQTDILIITDVRFPNEAQRIKDLGGIVINVIRDVPQVDDPNDPDNQLNGWAFDGILMNTGTKKELNQYILEMLNVYIS